MWAIDRGVSFSSANYLTPEYLDSIDLFVLSSVRATSGVQYFPALTADEQEALYQFVLNGGNLFYSSGTIGNPGIGALADASVLGPFGLHYTQVIGYEGTAQFNDLQHPIAASDWGGPFSEYRVRSGGYYDDLGPFGISLANTADANYPVLVEIPRNALGPGSGRVIVNSSTHALTDYAGSLTVNIAAYLLVPEPSTWAMFASGGVTALGAAWLRRRRDSAPAIDVGKT